MTDYFDLPNGLRIFLHEISRMGDVHPNVFDQRYFFYLRTETRNKYSAAYSTEFEAIVVRAALIGVLLEQSPGLRVDK